MPSDSEITRLLHRWREGDASAPEALMPLVYEQLRALASRYMKGERQDHTLRATALVHEAYVKLAAGGLPYEDRVHFFAVAARVMRRILVDYARARGRAKRAGGERLTLDEGLVMAPQASGALEALDEALTRLEAFDKRKCQVVEMLYFGGLTYEEIAAALGVSDVTVHRDLKIAKAWLQNELRGDGS
jgi:RNA polymerase sigma factor (TIGR02999 family)